MNPHLNQSHRQTSRSKNGFTLTEMLVTIGIIATLATVAFFMGSRAVESAKASKCVSNLRQIGILLQDIASEGVNDGHHVPGTYPPYAGQIYSPWRKFNLNELLGEKAGYCEVDGNQYRWSVPPSDTFLQNPLADGKLAGDVDFETLSNNNFKSANGYSYNHLIGDWTAAHSKDPRITYIADIEYPELTIIMAEARAVPKNAKGNDANGKLWFGPYSGAVPEGTYKNSVNCLMVDGHVELIPNDYLTSDEGEDRRLRIYNN